MSPGSQHDSAVALRAQLRSYLAAERAFTECEDAEVVERAEDFIVAFELLQRSTSAIIAALRETAGKEGAR